MNTEGQVYSPSFKDPDGQVFDLDGRLVRAVHRRAIPPLRARLGSKLFARLVEEGRLIPTLELAETEKIFFRSAIKNRSRFSDEDIGDIFEHPRLSFLSYPYEWAPEMLSEAGRLTLDLAESLLSEDQGLKDATPYNIVFRGPKPVFVDILSFEPRDRRNSLWLAYGQFSRMFVNPLILQKHLGLRPSQVSVNRHRGILAEEVYSVSTLRRRLLPPLLGSVTLPTLLGKWAKAKGGAIPLERTETSPEKADFILLSHFRRLKRQIERVTPKRADNPYYENTETKAPQYLEGKERFLRTVLEELEFKSCLDLGCNTGKFSLLAAEKGAAVVAIDSEPRAAGKLWGTARQRGLNLLPLVMDIASPSPRLGWLHQECLSFLDRFAASFDLVLMLALVHHLLVTESVPLSEILNLGALLTKDSLVIEYIDPADELFQSISLGRDFGYLTRESFEAECRKKFQIVRSEPQKQGLRCLYWLKKVA